MSQSLGRYELVESLGQGGMGEVWLAKLSGAAGFQKPCLVKTVLPSLKADPDFVQRFMHEAKVLVHLQHSNIAQVYDMGDEGGVLYMALELVQGVDLAALIHTVKQRGELLPVPVALHVAQQAAEGLGYAHRRLSPEGQPLDIVHRDVSPQNIMVSYDGEVKVIDFGIAKSAARTKATGQAMVMGKLGYMAPEQARAVNVDARADQYALAVVLWEMLSGQSFIASGTVAEMVAAMANPNPPKLSQLRPEVDAELQQVIEKALKVHREERYARADDFAIALSRQLERLGGRPTKEQVGQYVSAKCATQFEAQKRLLSKLSTLRAVAPGAAVVAAPARQVLATPISTGEAMAQVQPSRTPFVVLGALLVVAVGAAAFFALRGGGETGATVQSVLVEPPAPVALDAGHAEVAPPMAETPARDAGASDAGAAASSDEPLPDAGEAHRAKRVMKATLKLQRTPVWSVTVTNTSGFGWSGCTAVIPQQQSYSFKSLPPGMSRELPLGQFAPAPGAPQLTDEVLIRCAQGSIVLPARD